MSSKTLAHPQPDAGMMATERPVWSRHRTWRLVAGAIYYPTAIAMIYVLVWLLARNEFALWLRIFGGGGP